MMSPLEKRCAALESHCAELEQAVRAWANAHERLDLAFSSFRGRVYAWRKWEPEGKTPEKPAERPLTDPQVSKAELRSRLIKPGKPFPHQN